MKNIKELFLRFWRSENEVVSIGRDILIAFFAVFIVLMFLWGYTGQWFSAPMVAIESGSMEHDNSPFGRLGTIDAGDMVLVQKVFTFDDIITYGDAEALQDQQNYYSNWGDVVIYKPMGRDDVSQIIHRAICWVDVEIHGDVKTFTIDEFGIINQTKLGPIHELGIFESNYIPSWSHSGYLTKGDNNQIFDQYKGAITEEPIKIEWVTGKARQEIPWIGTINLFFEDLLHGKTTIQNVHQDSLICLGIVIAVLISIPVVLDVYDYMKQKKKKQM